MSSSHPTNNIIAGTLRTLVQLVPMAGGAIAQAWTEYESFHQNRRTVAKLVARGLIHDAVINAGFGYSGDASSSFNRFRSKAWTITPMGRKLLQAIKI